MIEIKNLVKYFPVQKSFLDALFTKDKEYVKAVDDVSFQIKKGEIFGLAGESGSGKTTVGKLCVRLIPPTSGQIFFDGQDITNIKGKQLRLLKRRIQFTFQDPTASLNPRMTIGNAIADALRLQRIGTKAEQKKRTDDALERVGLTPPEAFFNRFPHQLSGGQRQRVIFARALILEPEFVVTDEPVAMVDVSIRAQILNLMRDLKEDFDLTYLYITHDLATARHICDNIGIMYLGKFFEIADRDEIYEAALHPYTAGLMSAIPVPDPKAEKSEAIPRGEIPSPINPPSGCRFHPRCPRAFEKCPEEEPELIEVKKNHWVACHLYSK
ncbi:MAG: ABC transporter ATP-binding protein [Candidatus Thorarchaeota archaeon]